MKSRQKNGRDSRSRETKVGEKIASTSKYELLVVGVIFFFLDFLNQEKRVANELQRKS